MTSVSFETATIADAIKKAARIAPGKGEAFDKAAGIIIELRQHSVGGPDGMYVVIRSTNLEVFYMEWVDSIESDGQPVVWRVPSNLTAGIVGGLPIGSGKRVKFEQVDKVLHITSARTKARLNLMDPEYYPAWDAFDVLSLETVTGLGGRMAQVEWAASKGTDVPFTGVYLDGKMAVATDRYKMASVPLEAPLEEPVTIPAGILAPFLKTMQDCGIGRNGNQLLLMPDEHTQIRTVIYAEQYPKVGRIMSMVGPSEIAFRRTDLVEAINRMMNLVKAERFPNLKVFIGNEEIAVFMSDDQIGDMEDAVELPGQAVHPVQEFSFDPGYLVSALTASPNDLVKMFYWPNEPTKIFHIDGGSGYRAWVNPRRGLASGPA